MKSVDATATWVLAAAVIAVVALARTVVDPLWAMLAVLVAVVGVAPAPIYRSWRRTAPSVLVAGAVTPPLVRALGTDRAVAGIGSVAARVGVALDPGTLETVGAVLGVLGALAEGIAVATAVLLVVAQLQRFTSLHLTVRFATLVVVVATVGLAGVWALVRYGAHLQYGTAFPATNAALMREFAVVAVAGAVAGGAFGPVFCRPTGEVPAPPPERPGVVVRWVGRLLVLATQVGLLAVLVVGVRSGSTGIATNAGGGLLVTLIPPVLQRDRKVTIHPGLALWIGAAVLLHAAGTLGPYATYPWFDVVTHSFSATVVAAVGYALARALDARQEQFRLPPAALFVYVLLFVFAAGVVWELFEHLVGLAATAIDIPTPLVQPSVADTVTDLAFDGVGGAVVALVGTLYLGDGLVQFVGPDRPDAEAE